MNPLLASAAIFLTLSTVSSHAQGAQTESPCTAQLLALADTATAPADHPLACSATASRINLAPAGKPCHSAADHATPGGMSRWTTAETGAMTGRNLPHSRPQAGQAIC